MQPSDIVIGTARSIIARLHGALGDRHLDETEFIQQVKLVLNGVDSYLLDQRDLSGDPERLLTDLYGFGKQLWLESQIRFHVVNCSENKQSTEPDCDYLEYCYDHIFQHGVYPR